MLLVLVSMRTIIDDEYLTGISVRVNNDCITKRVVKMGIPEG